MFSLKPWPFQGWKGNLVFFTGKYFRSSETVKFIFCVFHGCSSFSTQYWTRGLLCLRGTEDEALNYMSSFPKSLDTNNFLKPLTIVMLMIFFWMELIVLVQAEYVQSIWLHYFSCLNFLQHPSWSVAWLHLLPFFHVCNQQEEAIPPGLHHNDGS